MEDALAMHSDSCSLRGKVVISTAMTSVAIYSIADLVPSAFGNRCSVMSQIFSRFRIKELVLRFYNTGTTGVPIAVGIYDDQAASPFPTTPAGILELRTSKLVLPGALVQTSMYKPLDSKEWRYCEVETGGDPRLAAVGYIFASPLGATSATLDVVIDYSLSFAGAIDGAATVSEQRHDDFVDVDRPGTTGTSSSINDAATDQRVRLVPPPHPANVWSQPRLKSK